MGSVTAQWYHVLKGRSFFRVGIFRRIVRTVFENTIVMIVKSNKWIDLFPSISNINLILGCNEFRKFKIVV